MQTDLNKQSTLAFIKRLKTLSKQREGGEQQVDQEQDLESRWCQQSNFSLKIRTKAKQIWKIWTHKTEKKMMRFLSH